MVNLWSVLAQTLALSVAALVLLAAKRLFLDKLSPRWQYGVWAILALRALLPAGLLGRTLVPGGRVVLEAARLQVELPLSSVLTDPYGVTEVLAPVPLFPFGLPVPGSITDVLFYVYAAGSGAARAGERLRLRPPAPGAGAPRPAGGRQGAPPRAAPPPPWRRVGRGGGVRPAVPALVQPTDLVLLRPDTERLRGPL